MDKLDTGSWKEQYRLYSIHYKYIVYDKKPQGQNPQEHACIFITPGRSSLEARKFFEENIVRSAKDIEDRGGNHYFFHDVFVEEFKVSGFKITVEPLDDKINQSSPSSPS